METKLDAQLQGITYSNKVNPAALLPGRGLTGISLNQIVVLTN